MMTNLPYAGKVVAITGAGGVICSAMARAFAQAGAKVAALNRSGEKALALAAALRREDLCCEGYQADVLDKAALTEVHLRVLEDLGPCDVLINGAGGNHPAATTDRAYHHAMQDGDKSFFDLEPESVDAVFRLNFQGTLLPIQVFGRDMAARGAGCILNISSMNAVRPLTKIPAYSAAKAAVGNFTQWLAVYFAGTGIRCNAIAPGFLATEQNRPLLFQPDGTPTPRTEKILHGTPMGRFVEPQELLGAALFLCDNRSAGAITGVTLPIDAGFSAYSGV